MGNKTKRKNEKPSPPKSSIEELNASRTGGQIALRGYSYQLLYSCFLILSSANSDVSFQLEGTEDIDCIEQTDGSKGVTHIQLKYSQNEQNASFLHDVLKNFLEAYLLDQNRSFKLVYDFPVAKGNLSKILDGNLDDKSRAHWCNEILKIKQEQPLWNWSVYDFDQFMSCLSFEKVEKALLPSKIEEALIRVYDITTGNFRPFTDGIKVFCYEKMEQRAYISKDELDTRIEAIKIDISKGAQNPAHSWIRKLDFTSHGASDAHSFYEGKKATLDDIVNELPIRRPSLEVDILASINENTITVIKASSGQGKTTLALQAAYALQDEYVSYQLLACDDRKQLGNTVDFFKSRIRLGEKILILIDNLDNHSREWNYLAQRLQDELVRHYKVLITSREIDWYNYSGDLSNIQSMNIIKPELSKDEAIQIFEVFRKARRLHPGIESWQKAWNRIAERQLLIEYVFLLTHGEMLSERISSQLSEVGQSQFGNAKCNILRKICFADVCGVKTSIAQLYASQSESSGADVGELLKNMAAEFLVHVNADRGYVEGLHPIRSKHIVDSLHEFFPLENTAISVIKMSKKEDLPILFSHLPESNLNQDEFCKTAIEMMWNQGDLSDYIPAIQGLYSGSVMQYYHKNQQVFDDANSHNGLPLISIEVCPFTAFTEFGISADTLDNMRSIIPGNENIEFLCKLRDSIPPFDLHGTLLYCFCEYLYRKLNHFIFSDVEDVSSYAEIAEWLYNIDPVFNLSAKFSLDRFWQNPELFSLKSISTLMYISFCGNRASYMKFVEANIDQILLYLKRETNSHRLYVSDEGSSIHVEYLLRLRDIDTANEASVSRLKYICKTLPIYDVYCADALKPALDVLSAYTIPDDAHKTMPIRNLVIMFHQDLTSLWSKTIMSNYEFDTVQEWLEYWFDVRDHISLMMDKFCECIYKLLNSKPLRGLAGNVDHIRKEYARSLTGVKRYPKEDRPFEEKTSIPEGFSKIQTQYFQSMQNVSNQFPGFLRKDENDQRLIMFNLETAQSILPEMQQYFGTIAADIDFQEKHLALCASETQRIEQLLMCCAYYQTHSANEYFNKYQIKAWYKESRDDDRMAVEEFLLPIQQQYSLSLPQRTYRIGSLRYYPVVLNSKEAPPERDLGELFIDCIPFADTSYNYLDILICNELGKMNPYAVRIPKQTFANARKALETEDSTLLESFPQQCPVEITKQMLECFDKEYGLPANKSDDLASIGYIAEELWIYSTSQKMLSGPDDAGYLASELQNSQHCIAGMLDDLETKLEADTFSDLVNICDSVFHGETFDNESLNRYIERFTQSSVKRIQ